MFHLLLFHGDCNRQRFFRSTEADSSHRRGVTIVAAGCNAHVARIRTTAIRNIESDPTKPIDMRFCPSVGCFLVDTIILMRYPLMYRTGISTARAVPMKICA